MCIRDRNITNLGKKLLICLPPKFGVGDAIEYGIAINSLIKIKKFYKIGIAFTSDHYYLFREFFSFADIYPIIISQDELNIYDTVFHITLEIKALKYQKYNRSNISQERDIVLLLPENPSKSANDLQLKISTNFKKDISIIITDSMTRPYRSGVTNFALASSNIPSLIDLKGEKDIYGNILQSTEIAIADELAAAAGLLMGQGSERQPIVIIKGFNRNNYSINNAFDLIVHESEDLYR